MSRARPPRPAAGVHCVKLQRWLPLWLLGLGLLILGILTAMEFYHYRQELARFTQRTALAELFNTKRNLENVLRRGDGSGVDAVITDLGLNTTINYAVFIDDTPHVTAATRMSWKGRSPQEAIPNYPDSQTADFLPGQQESLLLHLDRLHLQALTPITLPPLPGEIRSSRQGLLLIDYDLHPLAYASQQHIHSQFFIFAGVALVFALLLHGLIQRFILRPVAALQNNMRRIEQGDFEPGQPFSGQGEMKVLDDALQQMARTLQSNRLALIDSEARYRQLSEASQEAVFFHENGTILDLNTTAEKMLGRSAADLIGSNIFDLVNPQYHAQMEKRAAQKIEGVCEVEFIHRDGSYIPIEVSVAQSEMQGRSIRIVAGRDIRQRLQAEATIRQLALFDALTGLPNRRMLLEHVSAELEEVERDTHHTRRAALAALNLDSFKAINDSLGMATGDEVLRVIARRLANQQQQGQMVARIHGDTFAFLTTDLPGDLHAASAHAARQVEALLAVIGESVDVHGHTLHLTAGAGIVMIPNDSRDPPELLREAETAMHLSKQAGDNRARFFAHALQEAASARLGLRTALKKALSTNTEELLLHYQPQLNAQGQLVGVEALVRWNHPQRGLIGPGLFIPEAETSGLIIPLGNQVLLQAARSLRYWQQTYPDWAQHLTMAVNVSPRQFRETNFVEQVCETLTHLGLSALSLELELTESVVADDLEATIEKMHELRQYGVRFALDDFGTGYSSLSYLKRLPIDTLKIDRSFVNDIDAPAPQGNKRPAVLIEAIITMAHQLGMQVLAEGVETQAQFEYLQQAHCDIFQGYFFSKPLPQAQLQTWAAQQPPRRLS